MWFNAACLGKPTNPVPAHPINASFAGDSRLYVGHIVVGARTRSASAPTGTDSGSSEVVDRTLLHGTPAPGNAAQLARHQNSNPGCSKRQGASRRGLWTLNVSISATAEDERGLSSSSKIRPRALISAELGAEFSIAGTSRRATIRSVWTKAGDGPDYCAPRCRKKYGGRRRTFATRS